MRAFLVRLAIGLYPRHVRERYGDEVAELLQRSPTPARDLANVALAAASEHGGSVSVPAAGRGTLRVLGLMAIPSVVLTLWFLAERLTWLLATGPFIGYQAAVFSVPPLLMGGLAALPAWRAGRRSRIARPSVVVPVALSLGLLALASVPGPGMLIGERWAGTASGVAVWLAGMILIGRWRLRPVVAILSAFAVLNAAIIVSVVVTEPAALDGIGEALYWYPSSMVGAWGNFVFALRLLPHVLTVLTVFILVRGAATGSSGPSIARSSVSVPAR